MIVPRLTPREIDRTPARFGYRRDDLHKSPGRRSCLVGLRWIGSARTCRIWTTLLTRRFARRHGDIVTRSPASRRPRPRPPCVAPKQSADWGTTGGPVTTGPIRRFMAERAPLLRFGPLQHTSAASRALFRRRPASGRIPLRHFAIASRPRLGRDLGQRTLALAVFRFVGGIHAASLDPADVRGGSCDSYSRPA